MTSERQNEQHGDEIERLAMYRALQDSVPGLDTMYRLLHALIASQADNARRVMIVGAGGGREIEELLKGDTDANITAIDRSARNLETARLAASLTGSAREVRFITGTVEDLPVGETFDVASSLLVMHHLRDDGSKLAFLKAIRDRLAHGGLLIHADVCFDTIEEFDRLVPAYLAHAALAGSSPDATRLELDAVPHLSVASGERTLALFAGAGLVEPREVLRTLWYRCWVSARCSA